MKDDTKKLIALGGLGVVGLYFLTLDSEDGYVGGGFGGGGGIPALPGDTDDAAEEDSFLDALKNLLKTPDEPTIWAEEGMDREEYIKKYIHPEDRPPLMKEKMTIETYFDIVPPGEYMDYSGVSDPTKIYGGIKKTAQTAAAQTAVADESKPWYAPWTWDWADAAKNYQEWASASTARTLGRDPEDSAYMTIVRKQAGAVEAARIVESRSVVTVMTPDKTPTSKKVSTSASRGYSKMSEASKAAGIRPGWQQLGLAKPTAPGQPDRPSTTSTKKTYQKKKYKGTYGSDGAGHPD